MVFTKIWIVAGIEVKKDLLEKFLIEKGFINVSPEYEADRKEMLSEYLEEGFNQWKKDLAYIHWCRNIRLFTGICCSKASDTVIIGTVIHNIYRRHVKCDQCELYTCCDDCVKQTIYGSYDVDKIHQSPIRIPCEKICKACNSDQVQDTGRCRNCFYHNSPTNSAGNVFSHTSEEFLFSKEIPQTDIGFFLILDDCLSCS